MFFPFLLCGFPTSALYSLLHFSLKIDVFMNCGLMEDVLSPVFFSVTTTRGRIPSESAHTNSKCKFITGCPGGFLFKCISISFFFSLTILSPFAFHYRVPFWRFLITGADQNQELKMWCTVSWTCLQTIRCLLFEIHFLVLPALILLK